MHACMHAMHADIHTYVRTYILTLHYITLHHITSHTYIHTDRQTDRQTDRLCFGFPCRHVSVIGGGATRKRENAKIQKDALPLEAPENAKI